MDKQISPSGSDSAPPASDGPQNALTAAIEGGSIEVIHWLTSRRVRFDEQVMDIRQAITPLDYLFLRHRKCNSERSRPLPVEMITFLLDNGVAITGGTALQCLIECSFSKQEQSAYVDMAGILIQRGAVVKPGMLHCLVGSNFSCEMGRLLIENGAHMEVPYIAHGKPEETPLFCSLRTQSQKAAEFARFLLQSGAKTNLRESDFRTERRIKMEPKKFARWAGMGWDDLVRSVAASEGG